MTDALTPDTLAIALHQSNASVGDLRGNADAMLAGAGDGRRRRPAADARTVADRLSARGPRPQARRGRRLRRRARPARGGDRRRRAGAARRPAVGRGGPAVQCDGAARRRARRRHHEEARPAQLRDVRREARVRQCAAAGAARLPRRPARRADLRGHLDARGDRMPRRDRGRDPARAQRQPVRGRQGRPAAEPQRVARRRDRPAARLSQPRRRAGRAGVRRGELRPQRRPQPRGAASRLG